ncbi:MAG: ABC transporter permease, partial [Acetobacteraceae bacterium]
MTGAGMRGPAAQFWAEFAESRAALAGLAVFAAALLLAVGAPWITPQRPYDMATLSLMDARLPPGSAGSGGYTHWLGTDAQGRDVLSAIVWGLRTSLFVGVAAGAVALVLGMLIGLVAAFFGGRVEMALMRLIDLQLSFPAILLALVLVAILGQGLF